MAVDRSWTCTDSEPLGLREVELDLVEHVARLHYEFGLTPLEIASRIERSPAHVAGLLERARDLGIVVVEVHTDASPFAELERELAAAFGLQTAIVVPALDDPDRRRTAVARATEAYVRRTARDASSVMAINDNGDDDAKIRAALARGRASVLVTDAKTATRVLTTQATIETLEAWQ
jgi:DNA-binding transcriptional regulator LsrR (DeoR family)